MREEEYLKRARKYNMEELESFQELCKETVKALIENPKQDFLGAIYMELKLTNKKLDQYLTPDSVSRLMAKISNNNFAELIEKNGYITVHDPTCGSGSSLIGAVGELIDQTEDGTLKKNWQMHSLFVAQDIDWVMALMCYIQLSLLGCAAVVKIGDSIVNPIMLENNDSSHWYTPIFHHDIWRTRRTGQLMQNFIEKLPNP